MKPAQRFWWTCNACGQGWRSPLPRTGCTCGKGLWFAAAPVGSRRCCVDGCEAFAGEPDLKPCGDFCAEHCPCEEGWAGHDTTLVAIGQGLTRYEPKADDPRPGDVATATLLIGEVPACTICGLVGHLAEDCPPPRKTPN